MLHELIAHGIKPSELKTKDGYDKHIFLEGSREHVLYYTSKGTHCSCKNCIVNVNNNIPHNETIDLNHDIGKELYVRIIKRLNKEE